MPNSWLSRILGFTVLFACYHLAEYCIVFQKSVAGFLAFQLLFFIAAWVIGTKQFGNGLGAWGLGWNKAVPKWLLLGTVLGSAIYGVTYLLALQFELIALESLPAFEKVIGALVFFSFGLIFSSLSEDVLTRAYIYRHANQRISANGIIVLSSAIYVLNHIYRLNGGWLTYLYLFLLGVVLVIPLLRTGNLWLTGAIHWSGNTVFYLLYELFPTEQGQNITIAPNALFSGVLLAFAIALYSEWVTAKNDTDLVR